MWCEKDFFQGRLLPFVVGGYNNCVGTKTKTKKASSFRAFLLSSRMQAKVASVLEIFGEDDLRFLQQDAAAWLKGKPERQLTLCEIEPRDEHELSVSDRKRMKKEMLNDNILNAFMIRQRQCFKSNPSFEFKTTQSVKVENGKLICQCETNKESRYHFIPLNINNCHWVLVCVDAVSHVIFYLDSMMAKTAKSKAQDNARKVLKDIAQLFVTPLSPAEEWEVQVVPPVDKAKQVGGVDCGVFVVSYCKHVANAISGGSTMCEAVKNVMKEVFNQKVIREELEQMFETKL